MVTSGLDLNATALAGTQALQRGDAAKARALFEQIVAAGRGDEFVWVALATACRGLGDHEAQMEAAEKALAASPRNVRALILKGDALVGADDTRTAVAFFRAALREIPPGSQLPPDLLAEVRHAQAECDRFASVYADYLYEQMAAAGFDEQTSSRRFFQSIDLMTGRKQLYLQQPVFYYFPGLPQIQFYERGDFPWLAKLEAATADIRGELLDILKDEGAFEPYVQQQENMPAGNYRGLLRNPSWSACYLWRNGRIVEETAARCPKTMAALKDVPLPHVKGRTPSVLFSLLRSGARIPPHHGFINTRLICHLPLIVPGQCWLRVGNETRQWEEGKALIFDDTIEHEAKNDADKLRVVLLFDIWRPELSEEERRLVTTMFEAIDAYGGIQREWTA
jgi:aspartyl/asparaginyl beta-hydroxylase (cupin superfamily)